MKIFGSRFSLSHLTLLLWDHVKKYGCQEFNVLNCYNASAFEAWPISYRMFMAEICGSGGVDVCTRFAPVTPDSPINLNLCGTLGILLPSSPAPLHQCTIQKPLVWKSGLQGSGL